MITKYVTNIDAEHDGETYRIQGTGDTPEKAEKSAEKAIQKLLTKLKAERNTDLTVSKFKKDHIIKTDTKPRSNRSS